MISSRRLPHGGNFYALSAQLGRSPETVLDLSSNTNIFAEPITHQLVTETPYPFLHYPDSNSSELCVTLAKHERVREDELLIGNGGAELIWHYLSKFSPRHVLFVGPIFSEFVLACSHLGIRFSVLTTLPEKQFSIEKDQMRQLWNTDADLVVLCTPNNPGTVVYDNILAVLSGIRAPRILIDNSYKDFLCRSSLYSLNSYNEYKQHTRPGVSLSTLQSFTKFYCCPGIRLGYLIGPRTAVTQLKAARPAWVVSPYAQVMGQKFLASKRQYAETLPQLFQSVEATAEALKRFSACDQSLTFEGPSFVLWKLQQPHLAELIVDNLAGHHGILVRNCDTIPGMPAGFVRIQGCDLPERQRLVDALHTLL